MFRVLINALASTAGGGITYLRNALPRLERRDSQNLYFVLAPPERVRDFADFESQNVIIEPVTTRGGAFGRILWEQTRLPGFIKSRRIDALVSLGNFALFGSSVPQILFNRNDLYFCSEFERDLASRKLYGALAGHRAKAWIARASIKRAEINVTPTAAFADRIRAHDGLLAANIESLHFGFDPEIFTACDEPLPERQLSRLRLNEDRLRLLFVSHYNYYRNFETLIHALPIIKEKLGKVTEKKLLLALTTDIKRGAVYGGYDATEASDLIDELEVREDIAMLGAVDYAQMHQVYRACDVFVCPSYAESFGHTLLEAMASGLPVVSADREVHREVCGDAALYFDTFNERDLAEKLASMLQDQDLRAEFKERGIERSTMFSWDTHVDRLIKLIERCLALAPVRTDRMPITKYSDKLPVSVVLPVKTDQTPITKYPDKLPVSVVIPVKNEERNIAACLESVAWADEVWVIDSHSTDETVAAARRYTDKIMQFDYSGGFPKKKNWALSNMPFKNEWVLLLDADERVTPELEREIRDVLSNDSAADGYYINRKLIFLGRWIKHCGWYPSWNLRLFKHRMGRYERLEAEDVENSGDVEVHEHVVLEGKADYLKNDLLHEDFKSIYHFIERHNRYSNWDARVYHNLASGLNTSGGMRSSLFGSPLERKRFFKKLWSRAPFRPLFRFLWMYFLRLGFLDGRAGLIFCTLMSMHEAVIAAKIYEQKLLKLKKLPKGASSPKAKGQSAGGIS